MVENLHWRCSRLSFSNTVRHVGVVGWMSQYYILFAQGSSTERYVDVGVGGFHNIISSGLLVILRDMWMWMWVCVGVTILWKSGASSDQQPPPSPYSPVHLLTKQIGGQLIGRSLKSALW